MGKKILTFLMLAVLISCTTTDDDLLNIANGEEQGKVLRIGVRVEPLKTNGGTLTRGYLGDISSGNEFDFCFQSSYEDEDEEGNPVRVDGDKFGICSLTTPYVNIPLELEEEDDVAKEQVGGVKLTAVLTRSLIPGKKYVVYYPYVKAFNSATAYRYLNFMSQKQDGVNNSDDACNYCCFSSDVFVYNGEDISNVSLHANNAVLRLQLKLPTGTYSKIELVNIDGLKSFYGYARSMVTSDGFNEIKSPKLDKVSSVELKLTNVKISKANQNYNFYMSVYPTTTGNFVIRATKSNGSFVYSNVIESMELEAGYGYTLAYNLKSTKPFDDNDTEQGVRYVDLGTSVYWATVNVGALSPTELGDYYAWGELVAKGENLNEYSLEQRTEYTWEKYKWNKNGNFEKYGYKYPYSYSWGYYGLVLPTLQSDDDIATRLYGGKWRVPSVNDMIELRDKCFWENTNDYMGSGVAGFIVYKAKCQEDRCKFYNHNGNNGVMPKETYDVETDEHIFLPSDSRESRPYQSVRYMTNETAWEKYELDKLNDCCQTLYIHDLLDISSRPSCLNNVYIGKYTQSLYSVYSPMLVRPVCDK